MSNFDGKELACRLLIALFCLLATSNVRAQTNIFFQAVELTDQTPGQQLWRYDYTIVGFSFLQNQGFSIYCNALQYEDLQNPQPSASSSWSLITVQPDTVLSQPGYVDGQASVNSPPLSQTFSVDFIWLGEGTPGSQPFDLYNSDFSTRYSGFTVAAVPEPAASYLMGLGLAGWVLKRLFTRRAKQCFLR